MFEIKKRDKIIFSKKDLILKIIFGLVNYSFEFVPLVLLPLGNFEDIKIYTIFSGVDFFISSPMYRCLVM